MLADGNGDDSFAGGGRRGGDMTVIWVFTVGLMAVTMALVMGDSNGVDDGDGAALGVMVAEVAMIHDMIPVVPMPKAMVVTVTVTVTVMITPMT